LLTTFTASLLSKLQDDITVVGRITQEVEVAGSSSKLTETTVFLESSRMLGSGSRIPLRFDPSINIRGCATGSGSLGLFPGAIVALKGRNGGGGWLQVSEIIGVSSQKRDDIKQINFGSYKLPLPRPTPTAGLSAMKIDSDMASAPFSMAIACGPYTLDNDLQFKPRELFFEHIKNVKPNVVLLVLAFTH
jgi:DNA polymerase alpha subunit B